MSARLGPVTLGPRDGGSPGDGSGVGGGFGFGSAKPYGAATADATDTEVQRLLEEASDKAVRLFGLRRKSNACRCSRSTVLKRSSSGAAAG
jgi:hypothetical protein